MPLHKSPESFSGILQIDSIVHNRPSRMHKKQTPIGGGARKYEHLLELHYAAVNSECDGILLCSSRDMELLLRKTCSLSYLQDFLEIEQDSLDARISNDIKISTSVDE